MPISGQTALGSKVLMGAVPAEPMAYFGTTCRMAKRQLSPHRVPAQTACPLFFLIRHFHSKSTPTGRLRVHSGRGEARRGAVEAAVEVEAESGAAEAALEVNDAPAPARSLGRGEAKSGKAEAAVKD